MLRLDPDARPQLSVFDRLIDLRPDQKQEVPPHRLQAIRQYKDAVMRDLEWLLNSRANTDEVGEAFPELRSSSYTYGLPDFSTLVLTSGPDKLKLSRGIQQAIELHEPRLTNVTVEVPENPEKAVALEMKLKFTVNATLLMSPSPEQVSFDTELELGRGSYQVKGG